MHNEDYITSGILELYAAGGLTQAEQEEVERLAATNPEIREALDEACAAIAAYAELYAVNPKPRVKESIMQRIQHPTQDTNTILTNKASETTSLYLEAQKASSSYKWLLAASVVLFLITGALSMHFYSKWQNAEDRLAEVTIREQLLAQNSKNASLRLQRQGEALSILRDPEFKPVRLQGVDKHPEAEITVYWSPERQQVYVDEVSLPTPPSGKQYQLWALLDGKPIDAGLIEIAPEEAGLQQMKNIRAAQAFAVTLEPAGGSKEPTLDQLMVMGQI
ncbi:anti-sigma factor [Pontibacter sp. H249]|uniref:anti-sigma factor n=1 Tax=Pontibacter sp. H249 TaxID=3133420 RepID=UPI0030C25A3E